MQIMSALTSEATDIRYYRVCPLFTQQLEVHVVLIGSLCFLSPGDRRFVSSTLRIIQQYELIRLPASFLALVVRLVLSLTLLKVMSLLMLGHCVSRSMTT